LRISAKSKGVALIPIILGLSYTKTLVSSSSKIGNLDTHNQF